MLFTHRGKALRLKAPIITNGPELQLMRLVNDACLNRGLFFSSLIDAT